MINQVMAYCQRKNLKVLEADSTISSLTSRLGGDNLEVKEQGSTRVLLTASSNQIEVLIKDEFFKCCL